MKRPGAESEYHDIPQGEVAGISYGDNRQILENFIKHIKTMLARSGEAGKDISKWQQNGNGGLLT